LLIDAIVLKIRDGQVTNRPVYVAMGITVEGERDVLGLWVGPTGGEGAKQWMTMLTELRNRGVADACIVCCDGLKGLPEAIAATWPLATVQTCVVHLVRNSLRYASKADWAKITAGLKTVYTAPTVTAAEARFAEFAGTWRNKYPAMIATWERSWSEFVPFLDFPIEFRTLIYTTDENVNGTEGVVGVSFLTRPRSCPDPAAAAVVKVERPTGRTTLTAARTAVASGCGGRGRPRSEERNAGTESSAAPLGLDGLISRVPLLAPRPPPRRPCLPCPNAWAARRRPWCDTPSRSARRGRVRRHVRP
jgi:hypothetical protein